MLGFAKLIPYCFLGPESKTKFLISMSMVYATMKGKQFFIYEVVSTLVQKMKFAHDANIP